MSNVSEMLSRRVVDPFAPKVPGRSTTLADLTGGQTAVICDVSGSVDCAISRRLVDLGFAPGTEVTVLRRAPLADPVIYRVSGYEVALRRAQACCIHVVTGA